MPIILNNKEESLCWGVWKMEETEEVLRHGLEGSALVDPLRLNAMTGQARRMEYLASRMVIKHLADAPDAMIDYTPSGKPLLCNHPTYRHISISHTKGYAAVMMHNHSPVGIDIEYMSERIHKIKSKFMNDEEMTHLDKSRETLHLLLHWSAKESMFKAIPHEEIDFKTMLHISPFTPELSGTFLAHESRTTDVNGFEVDYHTTSEFVLTHLVYPIKPDSFSP